MDINTIVKELIEKGYTIEIEVNGVVEMLITADNVNEVKFNLGRE